MSDVIDNKVVQFTFDGGQFEKDIADVISSLDDLNDKVDKLSSKSGTEIFKGMSSQMGDLVKGMGELGEAADLAKEKFSALGTITDQIFRNIGNKISSRLAGLFGGITKGVTSGFNEYELKMGSIQTIMQGTGESLETVSAQLDELNHYADNTIYSFKDMTDNISKFTNAGVKLNDAVAAIKGVANEAALAGANSLQASRAMYNFSQALSTGKVNLIDWKSIENAQMATTEFREVLVQTGEAMGTLVKQGEAWKSVTTDAQGNTSDLFNAMTGFRDSLKANWLTKDVLTKALKIYATDVREFKGDVDKLREYEKELKDIGFSDEQIKAFEEIGERAADAAKDVKSFTMMMDTLNEAIGSGWAATWEKIFGNFDEAKALWTGMSEDFDEIISKIQDFRNNALDVWKGLGGRDSFLNSIANVLNAIMTYIWPIKSAFQAVFTEFSSADKAGEALDGATTGLEKFTAMLKLTPEYMVKVRQNLVVVFTGVKKVLDTIMTYKKPILQFISQIVMLKALKSMFTGGLGLGTVFNLLKFIIALNISKRLSGIENNAIDLSTIIQVIGETVQNVGDKIRSVFKKISDSSAFQGIISVLKVIGQVLMVLFALAVEGIGKIIEKIKEIKWEDVKEGLSKVKGVAVAVFGAIVFAITKAVGGIKNLIGLIKSLGLAIGEKLSSLNIPTPDFSKITKEFESLKERSSNVVEFIKNLFSDLKEYISSKFTSLFSSEEEGPKTSWLDNIKEKFSALGDIDLSGLKFSLPSFKGLSGLKDIFSAPVTASANEAFSTINNPSNFSFVDNFAKAGEAVKGFFEELAPMQAYAGEVGEFSDKVEGLQQTAYVMDDAVATSANNAGQSITAVGTAASNSVDAIKALGTFISNIIAKINEKIGDLQEKLPGLSEFIQKLEKTPWATIFNIGGLVAYILYIRLLTKASTTLGSGLDKIATAISNHFTPVLDGAKAVMDSLSKAISGVGGAIKTYFTSLTNINKAKQFKEIAEGIALLTGSLIALSVIPLDPAKLLGAAVAIILVASAVSAFAKSMGEASANADTKNLGLLMAAVAEFGFLVAEISSIMAVAALVTEHMINESKDLNEAWTRILAPLAQVGGVIMTVIGTMLLFRALNQPIRTGATAMLKAAAAIAAMSGAVLLLNVAVQATMINLKVLIHEFSNAGQWLYEKISGIVELIKMCASITNELGQNASPWTGILTFLKIAGPKLLAIGAAILSVIGSIKIIGAISKSITKNGWTAAGALIGLSSALLILSFSLKNFDNVKNVRSSLLQFAAALISVVLALAALELFTTLLFNTAEEMEAGANAIKSLGTAAIGIAGAMLIMSLAVKKMGDIDPNKINQGFDAVALLMIVMAASIKLMGKADIKGVALAIISMTAAIYLLIPAMTILGALAPVVAPGMVMIATMFIAIGAAVRLMSGVQAKTIIPIVAAMTVAVSWLAYVATLLASFPDQGKLWSAVGAIAVLEVVMTVLTRFVSNSTKNMKTNEQGVVQLIGFAATVISMAGAVALMAEGMKQILDTQATWQQIAVVGGVLAAAMLVFGKVFDDVAVLVKRMSDLNIQGFVATVISMAAVVGAIGTVMSFLAGHDWQNVAVSAAALSGALIAFGVTIKIIESSLTPLLMNLKVDTIASVLRALIINLNFTIAELGAVTIALTAMKPSIATAGIVLLEFGGMLLTFAAVSAIMVKVANSLNYGTIGTFVGIVVMMGIIVAEIGLFLIQLNGLKPSIEQAGAVVLEFGGMLVAFAAAVAIIGTVAKSLKAGDVVKFGVIVAAIGVVTALIGQVVIKLTELQPNMDTAKAVLVEFGGMLGIFAISVGGLGLIVAGLSALVGLVPGIKLGLGILTVCFGLLAVAGVLLANALAKFLPPLQEFIVTIGSMDANDLLATSNALGSYGGNLTKLGLGAVVGAAGMGLFSLAAGGFVSAIYAIKSLFTDSDAYTWGYDFTSNVASGIADAAPIAGAAGYTVARATADYVECSTAKEYPWSEAATWGPDLVSNIFSDTGSMENISSLAGEFVADVFRVAFKSILKGIQDDIDTTLTDAWTSFTEKLKKANEDFWGSIGMGTLHAQAGEVGLFGGMDEETQKQIDQLGTKAEELGKKVEDVSSDIKDTVSDTTEDIGKKVDDATKKLENGETEKKAEDAADKVSDKFTEAADNAQKNLAGVGNKVKEKVSEVTDDVNKKIESASSDTEQFGLAGIMNVLEGVKSGEYDLTTGIGIIAEHASEWLQEKFGGVERGIQVIKDTWAGMEDGKDFLTAAAGAVGAAAGDNLGKKMVAAAMPYMSMLMSWANVASIATQSQLNTIKQSGMQTGSVKTSREGSSTRTTVNRTGSGDALKEAQRTEQLLGHRNYKNDKDAQADVDKFIEEQNKKNEEANKSIMDQLKDEYDALRKEAEDWGNFFNSDDWKNAVPSTTGGGGTGSTDLPDSDDGKKKKDKTKKGSKGKTKDNSKALEEEAKRRQNMEKYAERAPSVIDAISNSTYAMAQAMDQSSTAMLISKDAFQLLMEEIYKNSDFADKIYQNDEDKGSSLVQYADAVRQAFNKAFDEINKNIKSSINFFEKFDKTLDTDFDTEKFVKNSSSYLNALERSGNMIMAIGLITGDDNLVQTLGEKPLEHYTEMQEVLSLDNDELEEFIANTKKQEEASKSYTAIYMAARAISLQLAKMGTSGKKSYKNLSKEAQHYLEYVEELKGAEESQVDLTKTVYGNIDTNNRQILTWNDENLKKFEKQIESWDESAENLKDTYSTIIGTSAEFEGVEIAFSPILQTDDGPKLLSSDTVDKYITTLIDTVKEKTGGTSAEDILGLDKEGLIIDGQLIKGLIADVGDTAAKTAEQMHYAGSTGGLATSFEEVKKDADAAGMSLDEYMQKLSEETKGAEDAAKTNVKKLQEFVSAFGKAQVELEQFDKQIENVKDSVTEALEEYEKIFTEVTMDWSLTTDQLLKNVDNNVNMMSMYIDDLDALSSKGLSSEFLQYLVSLGPEYAAVALRLTDEQLKEIDKKYTEQKEKAKKAATDVSKNFKENGTFHGKTYTQALEDAMLDEEKIKEISELYSEAFGKELTIDMTGSALEVAEQVVAAVASELDTKNADVNNIKTWTEKTGETVDSTTAESITENGGQVSDATVEVVKTANTNAQNNLTENDGYGIGKNYTQGVANGLADSEAMKALTDNATAIGTAAKNATKAALNENSPSKEGYQIGAYYTEGFASGVADRASTNEVLDNAIKFATDMDNAVKDTLEIHSPSEVDKENAVNYKKGATEGFKDTSSTKEAVDAATQFATELNDAVTGTLEKTDDSTIADNIIAAIDLNKGKLVKATEKTALTINERISKILKDGAANTIANYAAEVEKARNTVMTARATYKSAKQDYEIKEKITEEYEKEYKAAKKVYEQESAGYIKRKAQYEQTIKYYQKLNETDPATNIAENNAKIAKAQEGLVSLENSPYKKLYDIENQIEKVEEKQSAISDEIDDLTSKRTKASETVNSENRQYILDSAEVLAAKNKEKDAVDAELKSLNKQKDAIEKGLNPAIKAAKAQMEAAEEAYDTAKDASDEAKEKMEEAEEALETATKAFKAARKAEKSYTEYSKVATPIISKFASTVGNAFGIVGNATPIENATYIWTKFAESLYEVEDIGESLEDDAKGVSMTVEERAIEIQNKVVEVIKEIQDNIKDTIDLFSEFDRKLSDTVTPENMLKNARSQLTGYNEFYSMVTATSMKAPKELQDLIYSIAKEGPSSIEKIRSLYNMSSEDLKEYAKVYQQMQDSTEDWTADTVFPELMKTALNELDTYEDGITDVKDTVIDEVDTAADYMRSLAPDVVKDIDNYIAKIGGRKTIKMFDKATKRSQELLAKGLSLDDDAEFQEYMNYFKQIAAQNGMDVSDFLVDLQKNLGTLGRTADGTITKIRQVADSEEILEAWSKKTGVSVDTLQKALAATDAKNLITEFQKVQDELTKSKAKVVEFQNAAKEMASSVQEAITNQLSSPFSEVTKETEDNKLSGKQLFTNYKEHLMQATNMMQNVQTLLNNGINRYVVQELMDEGAFAVEHATEWSALQIEEINAMYDEAEQLKQDAYDWTEDTVLQTLEINGEKYSDAVKEWFVDSKIAEAFADELSKALTVKLDGDLSTDDALYKMSQSLAEYYNKNEEELLTTVSEFGYDLTKSFSTGISGDAAKEAATKSANDIIAEVKEKLRANCDDNKWYIEDTGFNILMGVLDGMTSDEAFEAINNTTGITADEIVETLRSKLGIASPSKVAMEIGDFFNQGLVQGLSNTDELTTTEEIAATEITNSLYNALKTAYDILTGNSSISPTITPVVDMGNVLNAQNTLSSLTGSYDALALNADLGTVNTPQSIQHQLDEIRAKQFDDTRIVTSIGDLQEEMARMGQDIQNMKIVLDTGTLVGQITPQINSSLSSYLQRKWRL